MGLIFIILAGYIVGGIILGFLIKYLIKFIKKKAKERDDKKRAENRKLLTCRCGNIFKYEEITDVNEIRFYTENGGEYGVYEISFECDKCNDVCVITKTFKIGYLTSDNEYRSYSIDFLIEKWVNYV